MDNGEDKVIEEIVRKINQGKSYERVAEETSYSSKSVISDKLRSSDYRRNNKFAKANKGRQFIASLSKEEIEEAGGTTDGDQHYRKIVEDNRIILELADKKVEKIEESKKKGDESSD